jgi:hypothetical protein
MGSVSSRCVPWSPGHAVRYSAALPAHTSAGPGHKYSPFLHAPHMVAFAESSTQEPVLLQNEYSPRQLSGNDGGVYGQPPPSCLCCFSCQGGGGGGGGGGPSAAARSTTLLLLPQDSRAAATAASSRIVSFSCAGCYTGKARSTWLCVCGALARRGRKKPSWCEKGATIATRARRGRDAVRAYIYR